MSMYNRADEGVQFKATEVFSLLRRRCSVYSDEGVQFQTAQVFNESDIFSVRQIGSVNRFPDHHYLPHGDEY